jgi:hypothetical protein
MAGAKKNSYISTDLDWAEAHLKDWRAEIDANPLNKIKDRFKGERLVSTKEVQGKYIQELMKNYLSLIEVVDKLRSMEEEKKSKLRGDEDLSPLENGEI